MAVRAFSRCVLHKQSRDNRASPLLKYEALPDSDASKRMQFFNYLRLRLAMTGVPLRAQTVCKEVYTSERAFVVEIAARAVALN